MIEILVRYRLGAWPFEQPIRKMAYLTKKDIDLRWRFSHNEGRNSLGLRNEEIMPKSKNSFRILFLGDSLVWDGYTSSGELYTKVIEKHLNKELHPTKKVEVINAGTPGYTTFQELEFLKQYGWDMQPDFVILGFVFNDVYYKYLHRPTQRNILDFDPEIYLHQFDTSSFFGTIFKKSYLAHKIWYAFERYLHKLRKNPCFPFENRRDFYLSWKDYGWKNTDILIGIMSKELKARNIPFFIVIFPVADQVNNYYLQINKNYVLYPQKKIIEISNRYDIPFIDLTEELYKKGGIKLFADYLHLNAKGNDVVADVIMQGLKNRSGFLKIKI